MAPYLLLSLLLGGAYGALFHLWRGKNIRELVIYFLTGIIGFGLGQAIGNLLGLNVFLIGPLHIVEATVMSWACLFVMQWLKV
ncbi:MAG: hypothetical protein L6R45_22480 [Anaerolineae bacterium]|nr:hypothetical protein [Anaerolineae bacterium]